jgi:predicted ATPase
MHLKQILFHPEKHPVRHVYPFNLPVFQHATKLRLQSPVTFFVGENGSGKSTLIKALAHKCDITLWKGFQRTRFVVNPYEEALFRSMDIKWVDGCVSGSFFSSQMFQHFAQSLDEWASSDPGILDYFGGKSLLTQSHGESLLSFFEARYQIKGLYLLDEPETALSPKSQLALLKILRRNTRSGVAQFIIATHSPILMSCPEAWIYHFDTPPIRRIRYEETDHFKIYRDFMINRHKYLDGV